MNESPCDCNGQPGTSDKIELNDIGFITVAIGGAENILDVFQVNNRIYQLALDHEDKPATEYHEAVVKYLQELGYPSCSHYLADRFVETISNRVVELKKKPDEDSAMSAGLPATTASIPSS